MTLYFVDASVYKIHTTKNLWTQVSTKSKTKDDVKEWFGGACVEVVTGLACLMWDCYSEAKYPRSWKSKRVQGPCDAVLFPLTFLPKARCATRGTYVRDVFSMWLQKRASLKKWAGFVFKWQDESIFGTSQHEGKKWMIQTITCMVYSKEMFQIWEHTSIVLFVEILFRNRPITFRRTSLL